MFSFFKDHADKLSMDRLEGFLVCITGCIVILWLGYNLKLSDILFTGWVGFYAGKRVINKFQERCAGQGTPTAN